MNLDNIINEELDAIISELAEAAGTGSIETFNYRQASSDKLLWEVDVVVPERVDKSGNTTPQSEHVFIVSFSISDRNGEKAMSIAFNRKGRGHHEKTGFGVQFKLLATITKIVQEVAERYNPDIFRFSPVKEDDTSKGNRRMMLYLRYVKSGAGADYDGFIIGNDAHVSVEKKDPSFPIRNGYQPTEDIQDVVTQLSKYRGEYQSILPPNDPDYAVYRISEYGEMSEQGLGSRKTTISARRFYDWMIDDPAIRYVAGYADPDRSGEPEVISRPDSTSTNEPVDAPIQRINDPMERHGRAPEGTFGHFMQNQVYGAPRYQALEPFYNNVKDLQGFEELKANIERQMWNADDQNRARLQDIINTIDRLTMAYTQYERSNRVNETLNRIVNNLNELLG
jgi:hypothetical protein